MKKSRVGGCKAIYTRRPLSSKRAKWVVVSLHTAVTAALVLCLLHANESVGDSLELFPCFSSSSTCTFCQSRYVSFFFLSKVKGSQRFTRQSILRYRRVERFSFKKCGGILSPAENYRHSYRAQRAVCKKNRFPFLSRPLETRLDLTRDSTRLGPTQHGGFIFFVCCCLLTSECMYACRVPPGTFTSPASQT